MTDPPATSPSPGALAVPNAVKGVARCNARRAALRDMCVALSSGFCRWRRSRASSSRWPCHFAVLWVCTQIVTGFSPISSAKWCFLMLSTHFCCCSDIVLYAPVVPVHHAARYHRVCLHRSGPIDRRLSSAFSMPQQSSAKLICGVLWRDFRRLYPVPIRTGPERLVIAPSPNFQETLPDALA